MIRLDLIAAWASASSSSGCSTMHGDIESFIAGSANGKLNHKNAEGINEWAAQLHVIGFHDP